jgi:uncharacterized protein (DUF1501 family)
VANCLEIERKDSMTHLRNALCRRQGTPELSRRELLKLSAAGILGCSMSGWFENLAQAAANDPQRRRACILLWMGGGPSQMDTFDLKPGHANGGLFRETATSVPGVRISEHLPRLARQMQDIALIRSMSTREGDHGRATFQMRTGYLPQGPIAYPTLGSLVAREIGSDENALPNYVSIGPERGTAWSPGFLGPQYAPLLVGTNGNQQPGNNAGQALRVPDLARPEGMSQAQSDSRIEMLLDMERAYVSRTPGMSPQSHATAYDRAVRLMRTAAATAFNLEEETAPLRDQYGRTQFGQGCLLARRLVERGVPFVEVSLNGWDTHNQNFNAVRQLSSVLDPAWSTLMDDLRNRGMLDSTLIVWMGEFGRTPRINPQQGRDHFPNAWSTVLAGGGINGGQAHGRTSADGTTVETAPTEVKHFLATVCQALGIDHTRQNMSNVGRPIRIVEPSAVPLREVLA